MPMRVKCPNSDIYLELPNDKMDMKFTCPACKKTHRVTVTITTPGEIVPVSKIAPPMPKKYATGAYPPVVDIPIDADFVLFDGAGAQQVGIDLGQAAETPPFVDRLMSERQTEIRRDPPNRESGGETARSASERSARPPAEPLIDTDDDASTQVANVDERQPVPEPAPRAPGAGPDGAARGSIWDDDASAGGGPAEAGRPAAPSPAPRRRPPRRRRRFVAALVLLAMAGAGLLAWQQYLYAQNDGELRGQLRKADNLSAAGDPAAAAAAAALAAAALERGPGFLTAENLWNRLAVLAGSVPSAGRSDGGAGARIDRHLARGDAFGVFRGKIEAAPFDELSADLAAGLDGAGDDPDLALAMRGSAVDRILAFASAGNASLTPEETLRAAAEARRAVLPFLDRAEAGRLDAGMGRAAESQADVLRREADRILADIDAAAGRGDAGAVTRYRALGDRLRALPAPLSSSLGTAGAFLASAAADPRWTHLGQVAALAGILGEAVDSARAVLGAGDSGEAADDLDLEARARGEASPSPELAEGAVDLIADARLEAERLLQLREEVFLKLQSESRRDRINPGTMTAWRLLLAAYGNPRIAVDPESLRYDVKSAEMRISVDGVPLHVGMGESDYKKTIRAATLGYTFRADWSPFFNKPIAWIADLAARLRDAGVDPALHPDWEAMEGPGGLVALTAVGAAASTAALGSVAPAAQEPRSLFFKGTLYRVEEMPAAAGVRERGAEFRDAARKLHEGIMADESIPQAVRQALNPVLMGAYLPVDPRDYFDSAFCRRLIEADYLEAAVSPMPPERGRDLDDYRAALGRLEAGYDEFRVRLDDDSVLAAVAVADQGMEESKAGDQDIFSGEIIPRYTWRITRGEETVFWSPMPSRFNYSLFLAEHYPGAVSVPPPGAPAKTEVWHASKGLLASRERGADRAEGDGALWNEALASDVLGPLNPVFGPPGWNFPLHVLERNDQGDPLSIATLGGVVRIPDFSAVLDDDERRAAGDAWLDSTAGILSAPGELGLIFHQFFRYCSDSPLPEMPNLIGSHYGLSDTHQTVRQTLERRWAGRLIGDCDDLAEFFQALTGRQGKLSYVMNLPAHAACGYVDKTDGGGYEFVVLQTGPVLQFRGDALNEVVEAAYRYFDRSAGESNLTMDAVPLLLRFADEETRTPFILSARIYEDREYADAMMRVQAYWHENTLSAAINEMRKILETDKDVGNIKELGSLYERVGMYEESAKLRREELERVRGNSQETLSTLLEIAQLHIQDKNRPEALKALREMEEAMLAFTRDNDVSAFMRALSFRSQWAVLMTRLGEPARAWNLVKHDVDFSRRQWGHVSEPVLRTLVYMYDKMSLNRSFKGDAFSDAERRTMEAVGREIDGALARGFFQEDDDYTRSIFRYFFLGRYAIARDGREKGLGLLTEDGPYPDGPKDHAKRGRGITDADWRWMRIAPQLYMAYGMEMLDREEFPELYDPPGARPLFENVARAVDKGTGLGADVAGADDVIRAEMTLSFINRDLQAFRKSLAVVKEKNYSRLYDDIAMTFGLNCGLIPLDGFDAWIDAFRDHFPGEQHYFKVVYRAIDKENYDHALKMAEATAGFFPDEKLIVEEAGFVRGLIPELKKRKLSRQWSLEQSAKPAA